MSQRNEFIRHLQLILSQHKVTGSLYLFSVDFVNFKMVNFCYGFDGGDRLLSSAMQFIAQYPQCLHCDRASSDHLIFLVESKSSQSVQDIVSQYAKGMEQFVAAHQPFYPACKLKLWCGIAPVHGSNLSSAIDNAYLARIEAKKGNHFPAVVFQDFMVQNLITQQQQENDVMLALSEKRFTFYLQPQVDLHTGEIIGAEALARGFDPDGHYFSPARFIPHLERNGSIVDLDYLILEQVCKHIRERLDHNDPIVPISVNLSRLHLNHPDTGTHIHSLVEKYHIPAQYITFELTENIYLDDFDEARSLGKALNEYGHRTSIDDFGSGYAGIDVFRSLDFDELKLDSSFLPDDPDIPPRDIAIIAGLVKIAHSLHISVICEGVEYSTQCQQLLNAGCRLGQGFYFSKPVPPDQFYENYQHLHGHYAMSPA